MAIRVGYMGQAGGGGGGTETFEQVLANGNTVTNPGLPAIWSAGGNSATIKAPGLNFIDASANDGSYNANSASLVDSAGNVIGMVVAGGGIAELIAGTATGNVTFTLVADNSPGNDAVYLRWKAPSGKTFDLTVNGNVSPITQKGSANFRADGVLGHQVIYYSDLRVQNYNALFAGAPINISVPGAPRFAVLTPKNAIAQQNFMTGYFLTYAVNTIIVTFAGPFAPGTIDFDIFVLFPITYP